MASISKEPNGRRTIQFIAPDGKRRSIRLGKTTQKAAEAVKGRIEAIVASLIARVAVDNDTAAWMRDVPDELAGKLASAGLMQRRGKATLAAFCENYIANRTDLKPSTTLNLTVAKSRMVQFFGADKNLRDITPADADQFRVTLLDRYAAATTGRTIRRAKQFFRAAVRARLLAENPFVDVKAPSQKNESRKRFITQEAIQAVLEACPDYEWRLIFALSRFGGLRCPSEHVALKWTDVDWSLARIRVLSPKTGERQVPLFPELRPFLTAAFEAAQEGAVHVIARYRDARKNLRTQALRIIRKAGLTPWPKTFHNLRASRQTELMETFPSHVVCRWLGNSEAVAHDHYLQTTEEHWERATKSAASALQKAVQTGSTFEGQNQPNERSAGQETGELPAMSADVGSWQVDLMPPVGLEPTTR